MPMNVAAKPEPGIETNGELKPVASAFASIVLPVPGGPKKRTPRSRLPPWRSNCSPDCQIETTRRTSSFASACPRTSSSLTPHCASPGSNVLICVRFIASSGPNRIPKLAMKRKKTKTTWIQSAGDERIVPDPVEDEADRPPPGPAAEQPDDGDHDEEEDDDLEPEAPEPGAAAADDVLLAELAALDAEQARRSGSACGRAGRRTRGRPRRSRRWRAAPSTRPSRFAA